MLLTDPAVQYWSCVVAVLATLAVLMLWNRVRGPVAVKVLSRFGLLLGGYLATTVAVLVSVNIAYGGLVVSVDDLFADINPPMGRYMHHHRQCGQDGAPLKATASAAAAADEHYAVAGGGSGGGAALDAGSGAGGGGVGSGADGDGGGAGPWGAPCPRSSAAAADGGAQAATEQSPQAQVRK
ncbi:MAG TPA: hypothetical protein VH372_26190 [Actinospica sp.]|jgi:hypothetical protein|nr:hypothetical protein [Actinospica sp.]